MPSGAPPGPYHRMSVRGSASYQPTIGIEPAPGEVITPVVKLPPPVACQVGCTAAFWRQKIRSLMPSLSGSYQKTKSYVPLIVFGSALNVRFDWPSQSVSGDGPGAYQRMSVALLPSTSPSRGSWVPNPASATVVCEPSALKSQIESAAAPGAYQKTSVRPSPLKSPLNG